jgi:hypothetical protein
VAFPLFLWLSWVMQKSYESEPALREAPLRKWLAYITLFVAGAVVAGDLITVIYMFLDGQELTMGFLLKVLSLLVVAGGVFFYYLREIRNQINPGERNIWRIVAIAFILASIVLGFMVIGSPASQRDRRHDVDRANDLQSLQWQIVNYWQQKKVLPATLGDLRDPLSGFNIPVDPETGASYEYVRKGELSFDLCATFGEKSFESGRYPGGMPRPVMYDASVPARFPDSWEHGAGRTCFERTIDPELYPPRPDLIKQ